MLRPQDLPTPARPTQPSHAALSHVRQVRLTDAQDALLVELAELTGRRVGPLIRDIVVVWAINRLTADGRAVDMQRLVQELEDLDDESSE